LLLSIRLKTLLGIRPQISLICQILQLSKVRSSFKALDWAKLLMVMLTRLSID
jgi:hypothetical protein